MIWNVYGEALIGEVEAPDKRRAEAAARIQYGDRVSRVQSRVSAQAAANENVGRRPVRRMVARGRKGAAR